jgi:glycerol uptake facilitator-like aquaporin
MVLSLRRYVAEAVATFMLVAIGATVFAGALVTGRSVAAAAVTPPTTT